MSGVRTGSLRRRVTLTALAVLGVVLVAAGIAVHAVFTAQAERGLNALLAGRVQLAKQLARQNVTPANLVRRVDAPGLRVSLTLPSGERLGEEPVRGSDLRQVRATLTGSPRIAGARLVVSADTALLSGATRTLRQVLLGAGAAALLLTALGLVFGMRLALGPLDAMTGLARAIAGGRRGGRLRPSRADTELGRAASAFDDMLDALEGAERAARASEERTRRFVADAAHELRTPIAGVRAAAEAVLSLGPDADPVQRDRLQVLLVRESERAGRLVEDLLELARLDAGLVPARDPVDLAAVAGAQVERLALVAPSVTVEVLGDPHVWVRGDADRLTQVLGNLVDNACRAMDGHGTLTVTATRTASHARLTVADTGPGVAPRDRERVFDRLVRLDAARSDRTGGAGLGLPIARGIARAHGGELRCLSREDGRGGAVFELTLP
ncbi:sensor histidine kinase [Actinophytocola oryzae]|uniref:histidine kinase n=1 Tax=Actinophytocola oryzae TaxID=502181 RepID=A0A4R7W3W5_9PSEU|nr:HAMP domain-containing sensor histidine kinase [Actinophytocola oryzae]TDV56297.1 signal transduction histidine kinase [Actinophytocola oryzae]